MRAKFKGGVMLVTADSMKKLADDVNDTNNEELNYILKLIRLSAENGNYHILLYTIPNNIKIALENFGFHVEYSGTGNTHISWRN